MDFFIFWSFVLQYQNSILYSERESDNCELSWCWYHDRLCFRWTEIDIEFETLFLGMFEVNKELVEIIEHYCGVSCLTNSRQDQRSAHSHLKGGLPLRKWKYGICLKWGGGQTPNPICFGINFGSTDLKFWGQSGAIDTYLQKQFPLWDTNLQHINFQFEIAESLEFVQIVDVENRDTN